MKAIEHITGAPTISPAHHVPATDDTFDLGTSTKEWRNAYIDGVAYIDSTHHQGEAYFTQQTATGDGTTTINWALGNKFKFTFGAANETFTFTAPTGHANLLLVLVQDGVGSRTATWPATVKWPGAVAPTLTTTASGIDIVSFYYDGTNYYGNASLAFG